MRIGLIVSLALLITGFWFAFFASVVIPQRVVLSFADATISFVPLAGLTLPFTTIGDGAPSYGVIGAPGMMGSGGVIAYIVELTGSGWLAHPGGCSDYHLRVVVMPTYWDTGEPIVSGSWRVVSYYLGEPYSTDRGFVSTTPSSGSFQLEAGTWEDYPIRFCNNAPDYTTAWIRVSVTFTCPRMEDGSFNSTLCTPSLHPSGVRTTYTLQNICAAPSGASGCGYPNPENNPYSPRTRTTISQTTVATTVSVTTSGPGGTIVTTSIPQQALVTPLTIDPIAQALANLQSIGLILLASGGVGAYTYRKDFGL